MALPNPEQAQGYTKVYEDLVDWIWDHPEGGTFQLFSINGAGPVDREAVP